MPKRRPYTKTLIWLGASFVALAVGLLAFQRTEPPAPAPAPLKSDAMQALYEDAPGGVPPLSAFFVGHSLVGRDMPAMLSQLMGSDFAYDSQLGWGTPLRAHYEADVEINGYEVENDHPRFRDAKQALQSGDYGALVLTEMVEIKDAIKWHSSWDYLQKWASMARQGNPDIAVYFLETWHHIDDDEGWLTRLDRDFGTYWVDGILRPALAQDPAPQPIYVIPGGQVMAAFVRAVEQQGGIGEIKGAADLMSDSIHFNDLGAYLMALTHYAVLQRRSPQGLPFELMRADGSAAKAPSAEAAALMQNVVWDVVQSTPFTGIAAAPS